MSPELLSFHKQRLVALIPRKVRNKRKNRVDKVRDDKDLTEKPYFRRGLGVTLILLTFWAEKES